MKKLLQSLLLFAVIATALSACSGAKNAAGGAGNVSRGRFTGTWTVANVTYERVLQSAVKSVFDQAPPADFVGSTWQLTNSGNGIYTLPNGASQTIYWSVMNNSQAGQMFQFKKIFEGEKARNVDTGYQLLVSGNDGNTMTLKSPIDLGSGTGYLVYTFTKAQ